VYRWLLQHAMFDVICFLAFVGASDVIFKHSIYTLTVQEKRGQMLKTSSASCTAAAARELVVFDVAHVWEIVCTTVTSSLTCCSIQLQQTTWSNGTTPLVVTDQPNCPHMLNIIKAKYDGKNNNDALNRIYVVKKQDKGNHPLPQRLRGTDPSH